jgi:UDP-N-acetylglucosamine diphosphorylase / glucose-1-phosphate thymidylyltransferase / UDP-N-acetylgalactosamine diphosphorylase / glucosamine-1-phosphate N-acetyltransferase / galactosamine-1-phosphate N-acetyltransferase
MKALVLAAAKSKKLSPFSETRPKSMINISGKPTLETILEQIGDAGISEVWIVVNHQKEIIQDHFKYGKSLGRKIDYIHQPAEKGIGHAVSLCEKAIGDDENFLLIYGDGLMAGNPFKNLLTRFSRSTSKCMATVSHPVSDGAYGNIYLSHDMKISKLVEKPASKRLSNYIFGGSFVLQKGCFDFLKSNNLDMVAYYNHLIENKDMEASLWEDSWIDISRPWHILAANRMMMSPWTSSIIPESVTIEPNVNIKGMVHFGENVHVSSGTTIVGPCYIGDNVYIGNSVLIRKNSSIGPNCKIGYGTEIKNAVLFGNSMVGRLSFIGDSVLGERVQLGSNTVTVNYNTLGDAIFYHSKDEEPIDTNLSKLGAFIGDDSKIGSGHRIAPGTPIAPGTTIPDLVSISKATLP